MRFWINESFKSVLLSGRHTSALIRTVDISINAMAKLTDVLKGYEVGNGCGIRCPITDECIWESFEFEALVHCVI